MSKASIPQPVNSWLERWSAEAPTYAIVELENGRHYECAELRLKRGQRIIGNGASFSGVLYPSADSHIEHMVFVNKQTTVVIENAWCVTLRDCVARSCFCAVRVRGNTTSADVLIDRWRIDGCGDACVSIDDAGPHIGIRVRDCVMESSAGGVRISGYAIGTVIDGCYFEQNTVADIVVNHTSAAGTVISSCVHIRSKCPAYLAQGDRCVMLGNTIRGSADVKIGSKFVGAKVI